MKPHWLMVAGALYLPGCASDAVLGEYTPSTCDLAEPPRDVSDATIYLSTFWKDKEQVAFDELLKHQSNYRHEKSTKETRVDSQWLLNQAFDDDKLPDVFQANGGSDVLRWVNGGGDASAVCPLDRLASAHGWPNVYFAQSLAPVSCRGSLYALPIGIHRLNVLFYNRRLFAELQEQAASSDEPLSEPTELPSVHAFLAQLERVSRLSEARAGTPFVPFAIGLKSAWPLTVLAFENVLLSLGQDAYQTLWSGGLHDDDDGTRRVRLSGALKEMLELLTELVRYGRPEADVDWQDAVNQVGRGAALYTVTGDWGWAQLDDEQTKDVVALPFPGTATSFVYTPDSFAVPRELGQSGYRARAFLHELVEDREALADFSKLKHSIPARTDFDPRQLGTQAQRDTYAQFKDCSDGVGECDLVLAVSGLAPPPGFDPCFDYLDALLTLAVTGTVLKPPEVPSRACPSAWPAQDKKDAAERVVALLLQVAQEEFAAACRPPRD